jgi:hypothetical protein
MRGGIHSQGREYESKQNHEEHVSFQVLVRHREYGRISIDDQVQSLHSLFAVILAGEAIAYVCGKFHRNSATTGFADANGWFLKGVVAIHDEMTGIILMGVIAAYSIPWFNLNSHLTKISPNEDSALSWHLLSKCLICVLAIPPECFTLPILPSPHE